MYIFMKIFLHEIWKDGLAWERKRAVLKLVEAFYWNLRGKTEEKQDPV